jgi:hypothetical protein
LRGLFSKISIFIEENTRLLYDLMHYLEQHNKTGLLLLVDFEKAFDSVEWKFLKKALSSFNFGPSVCKWQTPCKRIQNIQEPSILMKAAPHRL